MEASTVILLTRQATPAKPTSKYLSHAHGLAPLSRSQRSPIFVDSGCCRDLNWCKRWKCRWLLGAQPESETRGHHRGDKRTDARAGGREGTRGLRSSGRDTVPALPSELTAAELPTNRSPRVGEGVVRSRPSVRSYFLVIVAGEKTFFSGAATGKLPVCQKIIPTQAHASNPIKLSRSKNGDEINSSTGS